LNFCSLKQFNTAEIISSTLVFFSRIKI